MFMPPCFLYRYETKTNLQIEYKQTYKTHHIQIKINLLWKIMFHHDRKWNMCLVFSVSFIDLAVEDEAILIWVTILTIFNND